MPNLNEMDVDTNRQPDITVYGREPVHVTGPELWGIINEDAGVPQQGEEQEGNQQQGLDVVGLGPGSGNFPTIDMAQFMPQVASAETTVHNNCVQSL